MIRLDSGRVPGEASLFTQCRKVLAAGNKLVDVGLVAGVPQDRVFGRVEDAVQRQSQLNDTKVWAQVAAGFGDRVDQVVTDFAGQVDQLNGCQACKVSGGVDPIQKALRVVL